MSAALEGPPWSLPGGIRPVQKRERGVRAGPRAADGIVLTRRAARPIDIPRVLGAPEGPAALRRCTPKRVAQSSPGRPKR
jgi:hypothetical protein